MFLQNFSILQSSHRRRSARKVFLKILQQLQESICLAVSLQAFSFAIVLIRDTSTYVFLRILRNFKEHHFEEHLRTTASYFMNKNRNNSSKKKLNQWKPTGFQFRKLTRLRRKNQRNCKQIETNTRGKTVPPYRDEI